MELKPGGKLGPYEIVASIGKGGMGEVWRARDPRLGRDVAIKVSAAQFTDRFEREAKVIASLNHPNVCTLYDVGPNYLVMELVEGPTLAEQIRQGPIALEEALGLARQIAEALEAAHDKGIVHRDLKPANVKIRHDGSVKVLDFGLAKSVEQVEVGPDSPTLLSAMGTIIGTAGYMSPEQARGKPVDKRADIWAFGVVLYEMLTGKWLFQGEDLVETLAAVVHKEPDLSGVPERVRPLLTRCLVKDPRKRLRDITGMEFLLAEASVLTAPSQARLGKTAWWMGGAAVLAIALAGLAFVHFRETPPVGQTLRYTVGVPESSRVNSFAVSPDGKMLVIAANVNGKWQLWLRAMDALQAQPMPSTEGAIYPFWSPDSRYIGFFADEKLKKVAANGGPSQALCDAPTARGGTWSRDDVILFSSEGGGSIRRVAAAGGASSDVMKDGRHPVFFPDGRHFLYTAQSGTSRLFKGVYVGSLDGKENRQILPDGSGAVFAPSPLNGRAGHILFVRENTLMALPFDAADAKVTGEPYPVAGGVSLTTNGSYLPASVSNNGLMLYSSGVSAGGTYQIAWFDRSGKALGPVGAPGGVQDLSISPDEKFVAFRRNAGASSDLWIRDLIRGTEMRFTSDPSVNGIPVWSSKGDRILFVSTRNGPNNLFQKASSGSGRDELLFSSRAGDKPTQWSKDGRFIVYEESDPKNKQDIWVLPAEGAAAERKPMPFLRTEFNEEYGQLSPDSHWMAFTSDRSGREEIYVRPFPPGEGEWAISIAGGSFSRWRADGKELYFVAADGKMMAVAVKATAGAKPSFEAGVPVALFDTHMRSDVAAFQYDVTVDGKRFLINTTGTGTVTAPPITVVTNWNTGKK